MLKQVWATKTGFHTGAKLERHIYNDGSVHYSFKDRLGRAYDIPADEASKVIRDYRMEDITEQMKKSGWIQP